jgi:hypothetical protein
MLRIMAEAEIIAIVALGAVVAVAAVWCAAQLEDSARCVRAELHVEVAWHFGREPI